MKVNDIIKYKKTVVGSQSHIVGGKRLVLKDVDAESPIAYIGKSIVKLEDGTVFHKVGTVKPKAE